MHGGIAYIPIQGLKQYPQFKNEAETDNLSGVFGILWSPSPTRVTWSTTNRTRSVLKTLDLGVILFKTMNIYRLWPSYVVTCMVTASWIANSYETLCLGIGTSQYRSFMIANVSNVFIDCSFCQGHLCCIEDGHFWLDRMLKSCFQAIKWSWTI